MKTLLHSFSLFAVIFFLMPAGCKEKDPDPIPDPPAPTGSFTATVAGAAMTSYAANTFKGVHTKGVGGGNLYALYIEGTESSNKRSMHFTIYSSSELTTGSYNMKVNKNHEAYYIENKDVSGEKAWLGPDYSNTDTSIIHGNITVTELTTTRTRGSFNFILKENVSGATTRTVTNGSFDVPLTRQGF